MEGFRDDHSTHHQSEQHSAHASDSVEDAISDEDIVAPTRLSLACAASKQREKDNRMVDQHESAVWDEVLEEADELAYVHKDPLSVSFLSAGTSKRNKGENRLRFSIRGSNSVVLDVKTEKSYIGEQEVSSGRPPTKASRTMMAELLENINEETEDLPSEFAYPFKKANISVAELLEDLRDRSGSSVGTPFSLHQHTRAKEGKPKVPTSGKKILALLGQRNLDGEDPLEHVIGETSSEEEDIVQNHLTLVNKDVKGKTMADLFQEAFNAANMEGTALPMRSTGAGYYGRMQQIIQMEKDRHAEFLRQYNREQDYLGDSGVTVQILSRSLEGKLTVCHCLFKEKSNFPITSKVSTDCDMDDSSIKRTIIFSPKICDNMDLVAGNIIHIYPPWAVPGLAVGYDGQHGTARLHGPCLGWHSMAHGRALCRDITLCCGSLYSRRLLRSSHAEKGETMEMLKGGEWRLESACSLTLSTRAAPHWVPHTGCKVFNEAVTLYLFKNE